MSREVHVRFCESVAVRLRRATRPVSESFFSGFKNELGDTFPSRSQGRTDAFVFIETYYNPYRRHSFNGNISPLDCEAFFARNGRRPTGVKDLLAEADGLLHNTTSQGKRGAVPSAGTSTIAVRRGPSSVLEGVQPSI